MVSLKVKANINQGLLQYSSIHKVFEGVFFF